MRTRCSRPIPIRRSAFAGFCFPPDVIVLAVRWYLRFGLSYRDVEELLAERGVEVDHVTVYRWVVRFTPLLADAARPCRHAVGDRWQVDETYTKVAGQWRYVYRAIDQFGQVIDVLVSQRRDATAARRFFERAVGATKRTPVEVVTDKAPTYPAVLEELLPAAWHRTDRYANNQIEADHGRLKSRLGAMRGFKQDRSARVVIAGHAFLQNVRRGHYELAVDGPVNRRVAIAFNELALAIWRRTRSRLHHAADRPDATPPARASAWVMRLWKPHDPGRSYLHLTIRHDCANATESPERRSPAVGEGLTELPRMGARSGLPEFYKRQPSVAWMLCFLASRVKPPDHRSSVE